MRRYVTVGGIVVTVMLAGSVSAMAAPRVGSVPLAGLAGCVAPADPVPTAPGTGGLPAAPVGPVAAEPGSSNGPRPGTS